MSHSSSKANLGVLRVTATNQTLDYRPFELSSSTLGIISPQALSARDYLELEHPGRRIPLRVMEIHENPGSLQDRRYRLMCLDTNLQLDQVCLRGQAGGAMVPFQPARFSLQPKMYVELRQLVTHATHLLESVNVSRTGILLKTQVPYTGVLQDFPLQSQVLIRLDLAHVWLPQTFEPKALVIHTYTEKSAGQNYGFIGLQFLSFPGTEARLWSELLRRLERSEIAGSECVRPAFDPCKL